MLVTFLSTSLEYRGFATRPHPLALPQGVFALAQNIRSFRGMVKSRRGITKMLDPIGGLSYTTGNLAGRSPICGAWNGTMEGLPVSIVSVYDESTARIRHYKFTATTATEISATSGQFGATRSVSGTADVHYALVRDPVSTKDCLVIQSDDSGEYPLVYANSKLSRHRPIAPPTDSLGLTTVASWRAYFVVGGSGTMPGYTNSAATHFVGTTNGTDPNRNVALTVQTTVVDGDNVILTSAATVDMSAVRQLAMIVQENGYRSWWNRLKIEISSDNATYHVVYDPTDITMLDQQVYAPISSDAQKSYYAVGFNIDRLSGVAALTSIKYIRFTWKGGVVPSAAVSLDILLMAGTGKVPGLTQHSVTYNSADSRAESIEVIPDRYSSEWIGNLGGRPLTEVFIPRAEEFYYSYGVNFQNTTAAELANGVDTLRIYRREPGDDRYYLVTTTPLASWGGASWAFTSGAALGVRTYVDNISSNSRSLTCVAPRAQHRTIPIGGAMSVANDRLFCSAYASLDGGAGTRSEVLGSEFGNPFRFRYTVRQGDPGQPSRATYPGERVYELLAASLTGTGMPTVFAWTEKGLYALDGFDAQSLSAKVKIAPHGTYSRRTVKEYRGQILWLDQDRILRVLNSGGVRSLSKDLLDNTFDTIAYGLEPSCAGAFAADRYYLSYPTGLLGNTRVLVYNANEGKIESLDKPMGGVTADFFIASARLVGEAVYLLTFGTDLKAYRYEDPAATQDLSTDLEVKMNCRYVSGPELFQDPTAGLIMRRTRVWVDDSASGSVITSRTYLPDNSQQTGSINIDVSTIEAFRYDDASNLTEAVAGKQSGYAAGLDLTFTMKADKQIFEIAVDVERRGAGADA